VTSRAVSRGKRDQYEPESVRSEALKADLQPLDRLSFAGKDERRAFFGQGRKCCLQFVEVAFASRSRHHIHIV
jgi:hypothetical protein